MSPLALLAVALLIAQLVIAQQSANFGQSIEVKGPSSFTYSLSDTLNQNLTLSFSQQFILNSPPAFVLYKFNSITNSNGLSPEYVTLYSFNYNITTESTPRLTGQEWIFSFDVANGFKDGNGKNVSIDKSTLTCAFRESLNSDYTLVYTVTVNSDKISCQGTTLGNKPYVAIVAKLLIQPIPSQSNAAPIITPVTSNQVVNGVVTGKQMAYYKIDVPPSKFLTVYYSSLAHPKLFVGAGWLPTPTNYTFYDSFAGYGPKVVFQNQLPNVNTYYIAVLGGSEKEESPFSLQTIISSDAPQTGFPQLGVVIGLSVAATVFFCVCSFAIAFAVVIYLKRKQANNEQSQLLSYHLN